MALIFDGKIVSPVVTKEVAKTKCGLSIDNFIGDVDANGVLQRPTEGFVLDLADLTSVGGSAFSSAFAENNRFGGIIANNVVSVGSEAFYRAAASCLKFAVLEFNALEEITVERVFYYCCAYTSASVKKTYSFKKLKRVSAAQVFYCAFQEDEIQPDETFPSLEYVSGNSPFYKFRKYGNSPIITFSSIKTINGGASTSTSIFSSLSTKNTVWNFPNATSFTGYIWNISTSYPGEIHFAVANQAAIEACDGYDKKWGFAGATIYFDLMLAITVDGIVYTRDKTLNGYTSWKDENNNIVYTMATAEPAVDTPVYSDEGITQVGTVSAAS